MRFPRVKAEGQGFYHCVSRVVEGRFILRLLQALLWLLSEQYSIQSLAMRRLFPDWSYDRPETYPFASPEPNLPPGLFQDLDLPDNP